MKFPLMCADEKLWRSEQVIDLNSSEFFPHFGFNKLMFVTFNPQNVKVSVKLIEHEKKTNERLKPLNLDNVF